MPDMDTGQKVDWGQERARIDRGLTQEKIGASDPAAAPMETDSESGGAGIPFLAPPHHLVEITWRTPRPETFGAWRKPGPYEGTVARTALAWGAVLVGLGLGLGILGLM